MTRMQAGPLHSLEETHTSDRGTIHGEDGERSMPIFQRIADKVSYVVVSDRRWQGVAAHAGTRLLAEMADFVGLTSALVTRRETLRG